MNKDFFEGLPKKENIDINWWIFTVANEFGWNEKQFLDETTIPYFLSLVEERYKFIKKQEKDAKKRPKRR